MKKAISIILTAVLACLCVSICACKDNPTEPPQDKDFKGITLVSTTLDYDGEKHSIEVTGTLPQGAKVVYTYDMQGVDGDDVNVDGVTEVGVYTVKAVVTCDGYKTLYLSASLTIKGKTFDANLALHGSEYRNYTGNKQRYEVAGTLPEDTTVVYTYNGVICDGVIEVGTYVVTATISKTGYETKTITRSLTINALQFPAMSLQDKTVTYDGNPHRLESDVDISALPGDTNINITYNGEQMSEVTEVGVYEVKWEISHVGYETKILTGTLIISAAAE